MSLFVKKDTQKRAGREGRVVTPSPHPPDRVHAPSPHPPHTLRHPPPKNEDESEDEIEVKKVERKL